MNENPYNDETGYELPVVFEVTCFENDDNWHRVRVAAYSQGEAFKAAEKSGHVVEHPIQVDAAGQPLRFISSYPDPILFGRKVRKKIKKGKI